MYLRVASNSLIWTFDIAIGLMSFIPTTSLPIFFERAIIFTFLSSGEMSLDSLITSRTQSVRLAFSRLSAFASYAVKLLRPGAFPVASMSHAGPVNLPPLSMRPSSSGVHLNSGSRTCLFLMEIARPAPLALRLAAMMAVDSFSSWPSSLATCLG